MAFASPFEKQPQPHQPQKPFSFEEKQALEITLMEQSGVTDEDFEKWVEKYMDAFRSLIEKEPGLHDLYEKDQIACLEYIKNRLGIDEPTFH